MVTAADDYRTVLTHSFVQKYDDGEDFWTREPALRLVVGVLLDALGDRQAHVLDVGTGRGLDAAALLDAGHRVTGLDLVELPEWRELRERHRGRAEFVVGDARVPAGLGPFDAVLDNGCLHHQRPDDYLPMLRGLRAVLRPGGLLVLSLFLLDSEAGRLHSEDDGRFSREFTEPEALELFAAGGFTVVSTRRIARRRPGMFYLVLVGTA